MPSPRAAIYTRISSTDPAVPKVEEQEARCRALAEAEGYDVTTVYVDDGVSAYQSLRDRPGWNDLKTAMQANAFDVLVFDRQDRLARDQYESLNFIADCGRAGIAWHAVEGGKFDLTDPMAVFMAVFKGGAAESYSRAISENVKRRNATDRGKGLAPKTGPRPFGWNDDRVTLNETEADLVRSGTAAILAGRSLNSIVSEWRASGIPPSRARAWPRITVAKTLARWRNAGVVSFMDEPQVVPGQWDAIVTRSEVEQVRAILSAKSTGKRTPSRMLSGVIKCSCGESMIASGANSGRTYQCSSRLRGRALPGEVHSAIMAHLVEPQVRDALLGRFILNKEDGRTDGEARQLAELITQRDALTTSKAKLTDLYTTTESMTKAEYVLKAAQIDAATHKLQRAIDDLVNESASARLASETSRELRAWAKSEPVLNLTTGKNIKPARWEMMNRLRDVFDALTITDARNLIAATLTVVVRPGRGSDRVQIDLRKPLLSDDSTFQSLPDR